MFRINYPFLLACIEMLIFPMVSNLMAIKITDWSCPLFQKFSFIFHGLIKKQFKAFRMNLFLVQRILTSATRATRNNWQHQFISSIFGKIHPIDSSFLSLIFFFESFNQFCLLIFSSILLVDSLNWFFSLIFFLDFSSFRQFFLLIFSLILLVDFS